MLEVFDRDAAGLTALSARPFPSPQVREGMTALLARRDSGMGGVRTWAV
ncbi:hypothetical protein [Streptomyces sp. DG1A-41]